MTDFSHINSRGEASMVDVSGKDVTRREASAEAFVCMQPETLTQGPHEICQENLKRFLAYLGFGVSGTVSGY